MEKSKFDQVDKSYKSIMEQFQKDNYIWENIDTDRYKVEFEQNNRLLDQI